MIKLTPPYKGATPARIVQGFHANHKGVDMISLTPASTLGSGMPMVAPEDVEVLRIVGDGYSMTEKEAIASRTHGWGIFLKGLETGKVHLYWHCPPYFPVNVGDTVKRGKIVAFMGNSGLVRVGGVYVPITERYTNRGTHLHWEMLSTYNRGVKRGFSDPSAIIDWTLNPTYTLVEELGAYAKVLLKMSKVIKK